MTWVLVTERYAVIDSETSGLTDNTLPADHPSQPRLAHLAMILMSGDARGLEEESTLDLYVRPEGWSMQPGATAVNGLTDAFLAEHGRPIGEVLDAYEAVVKAGYVVVAHLAQYDCKIMRGELRRAGRPDLFEQTPNICTARAFKEYRGIFKGFKLEDACRYFGIEYTRKHCAPADAVACQQVFLRLRSMGALPPAAVHRSKDHAAIAARGMDTMTALRASVTEIDGAIYPGTVVAEPALGDQNTYPQPSYRVIE